jgi:hypothetical protein
LEVGGELLVSKNRETDALPMSVAASFIYDEATEPVDSGTEGVYRSIRRYSKAEAVIKVKDQVTKPSLRETRRDVVCDGSNGLALYSAGGPLTREELDLLEIPGNSLILDQLLPGKAVRPGDSWPVADELLKQLLTLDAVASSEVHGKVKEVKEEAVDCELSGTIEGAVDGASTELEISGGFRFDRKEGGINKVALLIKEKRSIGQVSPGLDVTAKLQLTLEPVAEKSVVAELPPADEWLALSQELLLLELASAEMGYRLLHDRNWYVVSEQPKVTVLRRLVDGDLIAQCNLSSLPRPKPVEAPTLAAFQANVEESLGEHLTGIVSASQAQNSRGDLVYKVVAAGQAQELPIQWRYHLAADTFGRQVALTFAVEEKLLATFGDSDEQLVAGLEFDRTPIPSNSARKPGSSGGTSR